jgi:cytochrome P450
MVWCYVGHILQMLTIVSTILGCHGDYGVCGRKEFAYFFDRLTGTTPGYAPGIGHFKFMIINNEEYIKAIYDTQLQRSPDVFIAAQLAKITPGIIPSNTMLNLNTDDPERVKRRALISEAFAALKRHPTRPSLIVPSWASVNADDDIIVRLTALNIFKWMFDIELDDMHVDMLMEFQKVTGPIALGLSTGSVEQAESIKRIYTAMEAKVAASETGQRFMTLASEKGMNTTERLHELTAVLMFAGVGGTSSYTVSTIKLLRSNPERYVPLYLANKSAFLKEAARLYPPVGGLAIVAREGRSVPMSGDLAGLNLTFTPGEIGGAWIPSANTDPAVFGGAERSATYAQSFDPQRDNLNKIMTWNGMLDDIERGFAPPGTPGHAPRACPGAIFALQMCEKLVDYFLPTAHAQGSTEL